MATRTKTERKMLTRQPAPPAPAPAPAEPAPPPPAAQVPQAPEPVAQWRDTLGDRLIYLFWLICFALLAIQILGDTFFGFLR